MVVADEIYDGLDFTNHQVSTASRSKTVPVFTLNGVSKVYYAPGWRIGYMALHDPLQRMGTVRDAIERLLRSRLCASTPAQMGYHSGLVESRDWMKAYSEKVIAQRDLCLKRISEIDGLEVEAPGGAFYMFVRLTDPKWAADDKQFVLDLLHEEHVLVVHGSGFSAEMGRGHFRFGLPWPMRKFSTKTAIEWTDFYRAAANLTRACPRCGSRSVKSEPLRTRTNSNDHASVLAGHRGSLTIHLLVAFWILTEAEIVEYGSLDIAAVGTSCYGHNRCGHFVEVDIAHQFG